MDGGVKRNGATAATLWRGGEGERYGRKQREGAPGLPDVTTILTEQLVDDDKVSDDIVWVSVKLC